jgi:hypothetical protein
MAEDRKSVEQRAFETQSQQRAEPQLVRATVERGRTIVIPHPTKRITAKYTEEGKPVIVPVLEHFGPGKEVMLPPEEVVLFRKLGYLVDPDRKILEVAGKNPNVHAA